MIDNEFKQEIFPVLYLTIVVCMSIIILSMVNSITESKIEDAKQDVIDDMLGEQFPDMDYSEYDDDIEVYTIYLENDSVAGYAFMTEATGYGGPIEILVALENTTLHDDDIILRGISIIFHTETPGLGAKIEDASFLEQFQGINANDVRLTSDNGKIDAISGATISSSAVVDAVYDEAGAKAGDILKVIEDRESGDEGETRGDGESGDEGGTRGDGESGDEGGTRGDRESGDEGGTRGDEESKNKGVGQDG